MRSLIFDLEGNSLTPDRIHCLSFLDLDVRGMTTKTSYLGMKNILTTADVLIGHNITTFDIPVLENLLSIKITARLVDTLGLSWYLFPKRNRHGLKWWGEDLGVAKVTIDNWEDLPIEEYIKRCEEDVRINTLLWDKIWRTLMALYNDEEDEVWRLIEYIQFKMDCAREQERSGWKLNEDMCWANLKTMGEEYEGVYEKLKSQMPDVPTFRDVKRPAKPFKKDGSVSASGKKWNDLLKEFGYPKDFMGEFQIETGNNPANPSSPKQVKDWLSSLGWMPTTFKYVKDKNNYKAPARMIPQVRIEGDEGKELCPSVLELVAKEPAIKELEGITVLSHRMAILKGFLKSVDGDGYVKAEIQGLTNTLRFKHRVVVNLPGVDKPYGDIVRGVLEAPDGYELMGSDMVSLEDRTKQHYIYEYDPDYVEEMNVPGFDPHLDLAVVAGVITRDQEAQHKSGEKKINLIRHRFKQGNYACVYGVQSQTLSNTAGITVKEAQEVIDIYWQRNWAVTSVCNSLTVKKIDGEKWLFNPVSRFWYSLRHDKDKFSTLNQGTATYVFDCWIKEVRMVRPQMTGQFHDEGIWCIRKGNRDKGEKLLQDSIENVNQMLSLNKQMAVEVQFGQTYANIH